MQQCHRHIYVHCTHDDAAFVPLATVQHNYYNCDNCIWPTECQQTHCRMLKAAILSITIRPKITILFKVFDFFATNFEFILINFNEINNSPFCQITRASDWKICGFESYSVILIELVGLACTLNNNNKCIQNIFKYK